MARKTEMYRVEDKGRDLGKTFLLTEMSSAQAENWAMRVLFALMAGNPELPDIDPELGMAGLAAIGLRAIGSLKYADAEPLLAEMLTCVQVIPDPSKAHVYRPLVDDDIEEVITRLKLRAEVLKMHSDFFTNAVPSIFPGGKAAAVPRRNTRTSRKS